MGSRFRPYLALGLGFSSHVFGILTIYMVPIGCPEASLRNYHYSLRNNTEERSSGLFRGGSQQSYMHFHSPL
jgi:hypothetical protein